MAAKPPPEECPVCGAEVPRNARACPNCGADERSGWNEEETIYDGIDLPEGEDDGPPRRKTSGPGRAIWLAVVAVIVALAFLYLVLR